MLRVLLIIILVASLLILVPVGWLHHRAGLFDHDIARSAARYGVDFYLIKAIIYEESWFRPNIKGSHGELGLMQVSVGVANDFARSRGLLPFWEERILEPALNVEIGTWYFKQSLVRYADSPAPELFALLRYNAGETRTDHWLELVQAQVVPGRASLESFSLSYVDYPSTARYASRILRRYRARRFVF